MDIPRKELKMGIEEESGEHGMSKKQAAKTAIDHLKKHKHYYSKLKSIGLEEMNTTVEEDFDPAINVEGGSIDIKDEAVVDSINNKLSALTTKSCITPYIKLQKIRELLAYYKIFIPQTVFLEGDDGHEVFQVSQFGEKYGMNNQGEVVKNNSDDLYLYFEWVTNDNGMVDVFAEIVDKEDLNELVADFKADYEDDEGEEDADGAESTFDTYKAGNMNEEFEQIDEISKKLMVNYMTKAQKDVKGLEKKMKKDDWELGDETDRKLTRRVKGMNTARDKFYGRAKVKPTGKDSAYDTALTIARSKKKLNEDDMDLFDDDDKPKKKEKKAATYRHKTSGKEIKSVGGAPKGYEKVNKETINEISKKVLGSYIKKASHDVATKSAAVGRYADRANKARDKMKAGDYSDWQQGKKDDEFADKMFKKSWRRRVGIAKAVDKMAKEDYDPNSAEAANYAKKSAKRFAKMVKSTYDKRDRKEFKKEVRDHTKFHKHYDKKAVTGLDEAKKAPDRVVTARKKAQKGADWRVQARNADSEGSEVELRQGKRVKMSGYYDRNAGDFVMGPTKKNKTDWSKKDKSYASGKDILKTVKEERLDEISAKMASNYLKGNLKQVQDKKGIKIWKAYKRADGRELAIKKLSGNAKVPVKEETVNEATLGGEKYKNKFNPNNKKSKKSKDELWNKQNDSYSKVADSKGHERKRLLQKGNAAFQVGLAKKNVGNLEEANEPFDGPYVQKGKEKSNPGRRADTIAHKALKAVKKKMNKREKEWRKDMQAKYDSLEYKGD